MTMTKKILLAVAAVLGLSASAHALDANCTTTPVLGIITCPEDSTDWYDSYTDIINTLEAVGSTVATSTNSFQTQLNAVGVSTTSIAAATAALQVQLNSVGASTTSIAVATTSLASSLQTQLNAVGVSTTAIAAATTTLDAANLDTATFGVYSGTITTALATKLDASTFGLYGGTVTTALGTKLDASTYGAYGATVTVALAAKQDLDADLTDLADGSLTGSKVGSGVPAANIAAGNLAAGVTITPGGVDLSTVTTSIATKLDASTYGAYGATVTTALATKLDASTFGLYGGTVTTALALKTDNVTFGAYGSTVATAFENVRLATTSLAVGISTVNWTVTHLSTAMFSGGFNAANQLVQLDSSGRYPALDGSQITGIPGAVSGGLVGALPVWTAATTQGNSAFTQGSSSVTLDAAHQAVLLSSLTARGLATFNTSGSTQVLAKGWSARGGANANNGLAAVGYLQLDSDGNSSGDAWITNMSDASASDLWLCTRGAGTPLCYFKVSGTGLPTFTNSASTQAQFVGWAPYANTDSGTGSMYVGAGGNVGLLMSADGNRNTHIDNVYDSATTNMDFGMRPLSGGSSLGLTPLRLIGSGAVVVGALPTSGYPAATPFSVGSTFTFTSNGTANIGAGIATSTQAVFSGWNSVQGTNSGAGAIAIGGGDSARLVLSNNTSNEQAIIQQTNDSTTAKLKFRTRTHGTGIDMLTLQNNDATAVATMTISASGRVNIGGNADGVSEARLRVYSASEPQLRLQGYTKIGGAQVNAGSLVFGGDPLASSRIEYDNQDGSGLGYGSMVFSNEYGATPSKFMFRTASEAGPTLTSTMTFSDGTLTLAAPTGKTGNVLAVAGSTLTVTAAGVINAPSQPGAKIAQTAARGVNTTGDTGGYNTFFGDAVANAANGGYSRGGVWVVSSSGTFTIPATGIYFLQGCVQPDTAVAGEIGTTFTNNNFASSIGYQSHRNTAANQTVCSATFAALTASESVKFGVVTTTNFTTSGSGPLNIVTVQKVW
jgi:hypothetical protein